MQAAIDEAVKGIKEQAGGPFGAAIVSQEGLLITASHNEVLKNNDPTAHAEIVAIRKACQQLNTTDLSDYTIYSTCEPCPMCLSAIIWANIKNVYYCSTRQDAQNIGFKDNLIYEFLDNKNEILTKHKLNDATCQALIENYKGQIY